MNHKKRHKRRIGRHRLKAVKRGRHSRSKGRAWRKRKKKVSKVGTRLKRRNRPGYIKKS